MSRFRNRLVLIIRFLSMVSFIDRTLRDHSSDRIYVALAEQAVDIILKEAF